MQLIVFTVWDQKAKLHLSPFFMRSVPEAVRSITDLVRDPEHAFHKHSEDYMLVQIGKYSEESGLITSEKMPIPLVRLKQLHSIAESEREVEGLVNGQTPEEVEQAAHP